MMLNQIRNIYFSAEHDLDKELFTPLAKYSNAIRCMTGYFTSGVLSELAQSLICFLTNNGSEIQFIVSPNLSLDDLKAINKAVENDENLIPILFPNFELTENTLKLKAVEALSYLIATKKLVLKIAIQDKGLFHTKCWLFDTNEGVVAIHGSINATQSAISNNFEQLAVNKSWESVTSNEVVTKILETYQRIWEDKYDGIKTISLNKSSTEYLLKVCKRLEEDKDLSLFLTNELTQFIRQEKTSPQTSNYLKIPDWLDYTTGDFSHQGKAVSAWLENNGKGILAIATGGGKTLTSLVAATATLSKENNLLIVIAVPTKALLSQWAEDIIAFNVEPINTQGMSSDRIGKEINSCTRRLRLDISKCEVLIVTHEGLKSDRFIKLMEKAKSSVSIMLIADEVHNLGSLGFQDVAPNTFKYRLGLSATVERQFDDLGTQFLLDYFGNVVFEFTLENAIGVCLVPFDYYVHQVQLDEQEELEWAELTHQIKKLSYASELPDGAEEKERWKTLCLKRRRIVESAAGKVSVLAGILPEKTAVKRTLIFCTDKYPEQIKKVNELLNHKHINFHQITAEETSNKKKLADLIRGFDTDELQVLTSKRVLDEGFNIPQTETAFLLASNTVKRQWIQRLGRVLRKSEKTHKAKAIIHDFVVIPSLTNGGIDLDLKSLIRGELSRVQFFDSLCLNGLEKGGTADVVEQFLALLEG